MTTGEYANCRMPAGKGPTKLQMEINHRESVVAHKRQSADALPKFDAVVMSLSAEDQNEFVHLIVREVSVRTVLKRDVTKGF